MRAAQGLLLTVCPQDTARPLHSPRRLSPRKTAAAKTLGLGAEGPQGTRLTPVRRRREARQWAAGVGHARPQALLVPGVVPPAVTPLPTCAWLGLQPPHGALPKPEPRSEKGGCSHALARSSTGRRPGRRSGRPPLCVRSGGAGSGGGPSRPRRVGQRKTTAAPPRSAGPGSGGRHLTGTGMGLRAATAPQPTPRPPGQHRGPVQ